MSNIKAKAKSAISYTVANSVLNIFVSLFGMVLLVRYLSGEEYGILALFMSLPLLIKLFSTIGYDFYIIRYFPVMNIDNVKRIIWNILFYRLIIVIIIVIILGLTFDYFSDYFDLNLYKQHFLAYLFAVVFQIGTSYITTIYNSRYLQKYQLFINFLNQVIRLSVIFYGVFTLQKFIFFIYGFTTIHLILFLMGSILLVYKFGFQLELKPFIVGQNKEEKQYRRYMYINSLGTSFLGTDIDRYIIGFFSNNIEVAIYAIATNIMKRVRNFIPSSLAMSLIDTAFYEKYDQNNEENVLNRMFNFIVNINNIAIFFYFGMFYVYGNEILTILFSKDYVNNAYYPILILIIFLLLYLLPFGKIVSAIKKPKILIISKLSIIFNIISGIPLAYKFGAMGMVVSTALSVSLKNMIILFLLRNSIKVNFPWITTLKSATNAIITIMFLFLIKDYINIVIGLFCGLFTYLLGIKILRLVEAEQKILIQKIMPEKMEKIISTIT